MTAGLRLKDATDVQNVQILLLLDDSSYTTLNTANMKGKGYLEKA
jgi:hypothetical protein